MIFYKPILVESVTKSNYLQTFLEIEFVASFKIGQIVEIFEPDNNPINWLKKNEIKQKTFGEIVAIDTQKVRIIVLGDFAKSINSLVDVSPEFLSFSPSVLGRFWCFSGFLETKWQNEEIQKQLLGSKLLEGKTVNYNQNLNWKMSDKSPNSPSNSSNSVQIYSYLTLAKNLAIITLNQKNILGLGQDHNFGQNCQNIITQIKTQTLQPIFIILIHTLDELELKNFYFELAKNQNLFNCFVIMSQNQSQNQFLAKKAKKLAQFFHETLSKSIFIISDLDNSVNQIENFQSPNLEFIDHFVDHNLENSLTEIYF